jgi:hypothetical protein
MVLTGVGMALTVAPLTTSVLASVEPANAGVAAAVNNTVARLGTVLAVAIVGIAAVWLYGRALDRGLAAAGVPADVARVILAERRSLADVGIPDSVALPERAALETIVHDAFLASFRGAVVLCAMLTFVGAGLAAVTIGPMAATRAEAETPATTCDHVVALADVEPRTVGCGECERSGTAWVHLRMCLSCGEVGCCDSSKNRHATKHFWATGHAVVRSRQPGETWRWCYVDERVV